MRLDMSSESLQMSRSESVSELNSELRGLTTPLRPRNTFVKDMEGIPSKPFGLGRLRLFCFQCVNFQANSLDFQLVY